MADIAGVMGIWSVILSTKIDDSVPFLPCSQKASFPNMRLYQKTEGGLINAQFSPLCLGFGTWQ